MRKKFLWILLIAVGGVVLVNSSYARWHVKRAVHWATDGARDAVPVEYQLQEAEELIRGLDPEIDAARRAVIEDQVAIESLDREIQDLTQRLDHQARVIQMRSDELKTGAATFVVAGRSYSRSSMSSQISRALDRHKLDAALLRQKQALHEARQKALAAAEERLEAVRSERAGLEIAVQELTARLRETQAMQTLSRRAHLDASRLGEVKEILARVRTRIEVTRKLILSEESVLEILPDSVEPLPAEVVSEVDAYFEGGRDQRYEALAPARAAPAARER